MNRKIISYNVNGIRAAINKGLLEWLQEEQPDILCLQETKAQEDQIDKLAFEFLGYQVYSYSATKKGYSGVLIASKQKPDQIVCGMDAPKYDAEGRVIRADYGDLSVISVYFPSGTTGDVRQDFKMEFLRDFHAWLNRLRQERTRLVISGDYNICRLWIDIHNPEKNQKTSGFLPEEREWFDQFVKDGYVDSFREINPDPHHYSWWSYRANARANNKGWRIDYNMVTESLKPAIRDAAILPGAKHSDHCPVSLLLEA